MSITVAALRATIHLDDSAFRAGVDRSSRAMRDLGQESERTGSRVSAAGSKIKASAGQIGNVLSIGVTAPILAAGAASLKFASRTEEALSKVKTLFGSSAGDVEKWSAQTSKSIGQSQGQALAAAGVFGNLFTTLKLGQQDASQMSIRLVNLASDLSSFHDITSEVANQKLMSGLAGESEPLRQLGVFINEASVKAKALQLGLADASGEISEGAKVQARYALILEQTATAQGDFARTSGSLANQQRALQAAVEQAAEKIGTALIPAATRFIETVTPGIRAAGDAFAAMPKGGQDAIFAFVAIAAGAGPLIIAIKGVADTFLSVRNVIKEIKDLRAGGALKDLAADLAGGAGKGGAARVAGGAAAEGIAGGAAGGAAAGGWRGALARGGVRGLFSAGRGAIAAAGSRFAASTVGRVVTNPVVGTVAAATALAGGAAWWDDKRNGREDVGLGGTLYGLGLNPWYKPGDPNGVISAEEHAEMRKKRLAAKAGVSAGSPAVTAAIPFTDKEKSEVAELQFKAGRESAEALVSALPKDRQAGAELERIGPMLVERVAALKKQADKLKPDIEKSAKSAEDYYRTLSDIAGLESDHESLKAAAMKEEKERRDDAKKKAEARLKAIQEGEDSRFSGMERQASILAMAAPEDRRDEATQKALMPVLQARMNVLATRARDLLPFIKDNAEKAAEFLKLEDEGWAVRERMQQLQWATVKEQDERQKKAEKLEREIDRAWGEAQAEKLKAEIAAIPEGMKAQFEAQAAIPGALEQIQEMRENQKNFAKDSKEYWEIEKEIAKAEGDIANMRAAASKERDDNFKKAHENAKKALDAVKKSQEEAIDTTGSRVKLAEAQLANNLFLTDRQRKQGLIPALKEQFKALVQGVVGETEKERVNRLTEAEGVRGQILSALGATGKGAFARSITGGKIAMFNRRAVFGAMRELDGFADAAARAPQPMTEARSLAKDAAQGRPIIFQSVLEGGGTQDELWQHFLKMYAELQKQRAGGAF